MSTYLYLQCEDHDPPIMADDESGQHLSDLPQIQQDLARRDLLLAMWDESETLDLGYFRNATVKFLATHRKCHLTIQDEYGRRHPTFQQDHKPFELDTPLDER